MVFDITSKESALKFLVEFLSITPEEIQRFIRKNTDNSRGIDTTKVSFENLTSSFCLHLPLKNISTMEAKIIHIATNNDKCSSIYEFGLGGIQHALSHDTPLSLFLGKERFFFDIEKEILYFNSQAINISYDVNICDLCHTNEIARKIYYDNFLNGFFRIKRPSSYGGCVHLRPEILKTMDNVLKTKLCEKWENDSTCYEIIFTTPLSNLVILEKDQLGLTMEEKSLEIAKYLVQNALDVVSSLDNDEIFAYVLPSYSIKKANIISIKILENNDNIDIH